MIKSDFGAKIKELITSFKERKNYSEFIENYEKIAVELEQKTKNQKISTMLSILFESFSKNTSKNHQISDLMYSLLRKFDREFYSQAIFNAIKQLLGDENLDQMSGVSQKGMFLSNFMVNNQDSIADLIFKQCKGSQIFTQKVLKLINENVINKMSQGRKSLGNLTQPFLLSVNILLNFERVGSSLLNQALRFLLMICQIQFSQFAKILTKDQVLLSKILGLISKKKSNGYLFGLIGVIIKKLNPIEHKNQINLLIKQTNILIKGVLDGKTELSLQIQKIKASKKTQNIKFSLINILRGASFYLYELTYFHLSQIGINEIKDPIVQLLSVKDFLVHAWALKAFKCLINHQKSILIDIEMPYLQRCILKNWLPSCQEQNQSEEDEFYLLKGTYNSLNLCFSTADTSEIQATLIECIFQERQISLNHLTTIPEFVEDILHEEIENQYDHQFNEFQFLSAINLLIGQIHLISKNIKNVSIENTQNIEQFKEQIINYAKMLLNLNESCLPESKIVINDKIYEILISFPQILIGNPFLQQVLQDLLISKLPKSLKSLLKLVLFYAQNKDLIFKSETDPKCIKRNYQQFINKINNSLFDRLAQDDLSIRQKSLLWRAIFYIFKDEKNKQEILSVYTNRDIQYLSKLLAIKNFTAVEKDVSFKEDKTRAILIGQKMTKYEDIFEEQLFVLLQILNQK